MNKKLKSICVLLLITACISLLISLVVIYISTDITIRDIFILFIGTYPFVLPVAAMNRNAFRKLISLPAHLRKSSILWSSCIIILIILWVIIKNSWYIPLPNLIFPLTLGGCVFIGSTVYILLRNRHRSQVNTFSEYIIQDKLDEALISAEALKRKGKYPFTCRGIIYYNLYLCYLYMNDTDKARETLNIGRKYILKIASHQIHASLLVLNAYEYLLNQNYDECEECLEAARLYSVKHTIEIHNDVYNLVWGTLYVEKGRDIDAKNLLIPLRTFSSCQTIINRADMALKKLKEA